MCNTGMSSIPLITAISLIGLGNRAITSSQSSGTLLPLQSHCAIGTTITAQATVVGLQRAEPHPTDPNKCIYENWRLVAPGDGKARAGLPGDCHFERTVVDTALTSRVDNIRAASTPAPGACSD